MCDVRYVSGQAFSLTYSEVDEHMSSTRVKVSAHAGGAKARVTFQCFNCVINAFNHDLREYSMTLCGTILAGIFETPKYE